MDGKSEVWTTPLVSPPATSPLTLSLAHTESPLPVGAGWLACCFSGKVTRVLLGDTEEEGIKWCS